jgi:hypothetical protein
MQGDIRRWSMRTAGSVVVVVALAATGCSDDPPRESSLKDPTSSTTSEPSTTTTVSVEEFKAKFAEFYHDWKTKERRLFADPDPDSPLVDELYDGAFKDGARRLLADKKARGETSPPRPGDVTVYKALEVNVHSSTEVEVVFCNVDGGWVLNAAGEVIDDDVTTREGTLLYAKGEDGPWRATGVATRSFQEGKVGCGEQL